MVRTHSKATKKAAKASTTKAKKPLTKHDLHKDKAYIKRRVSKDFDGAIYNGTVIKFNSKHRLWAVEYDDGDGEEMDWNDLQKALKLHDDKNKGKKRKSSNGKNSAPSVIEEESVDGKKKISTKKKKASPPAQDVKPKGTPTKPAASTTAEMAENKKSEEKTSPPPTPASASENFRVVRTTYPSHGSGSDEEEYVVGEYATREEANKAARDEMESIPQFEDWGEGQFAGKSPPYSSIDGPFDAIADEDEFVKIYVVDIAKEEEKEKKTLEAVMKSKPPAKKKSDPSKRKFGKTDQPIAVDANLFARNPCRIPGGTTRLPSAYPNYTKGKGSFGFLMQRLSDRNYAMRAMCLEGHGAEYNTYKKASGFYISVVWYPPTNLDNHKNDATIVDGCHLDLIDPSDGKTYLTGKNLDSAIVNAAEPVECLFLNASQSNPGSSLSADDIALAITKCKDSLQCLALSECKLDAAIISALASCSKLRGVIIDSCELWGEGDNRPTDAGLSRVLGSCPDLRWCFVKSSMFGADCWNALAKEGACPNLELLWVDAPLHTEDRIDTAKGDHATIRAALERRADKLKLFMINPDENYKSRYLVGGGKGTDRLNGRARTEEEKYADRSMQGSRWGSYLSKV